MKKLFSIISVVVLLLSLLTISAFAVSETFDWGNISFLYQEYVGQRTYAYDDVGYSYIYATSNAPNAYFTTTIQRKDGIWPFQSWTDLNTSTAYGTMNSYAEWGYGVPDCNSGNKTFRFFLQAYDYIIPGDDTHGDTACNIRFNNFYTASSE